MSSTRPSTVRLIADSLSPSRHALRVQVLATLRVCSQCAEYKKEILTQSLNSEWTTYRLNECRLAKHCSNYLGRTPESGAYARCSQELADSVLFELGVESQLARWFLASLLQKRSFTDLL